MSFSSSIRRLFILVFITASSPYLHTDGNTLSSEEIMNRCVARAELQYRAMEEVHFESEATTENRKFNGDGEITETEILEQIQYPLQGAVFEEIVSINGRPLNEEEKEKEEDKKRKFVEEVEKRRARGDYLQPEKERAIQFNEDFASRYTYELVGTEEVRNFLCWVISFKPKEGKLPVRRTMDNALNQLFGTLWVSQDDYGLVRVDFAMRKPFKYWGGLVAVIRKTDGSVEYDRIEPNIWLPRHFELTLDIRIMLFKNIRQTITKDWRNYRRVSSTGIRTDTGTSTSTDLTYP
jgi:hypothetical protein